MSVGQRIKLNKQIYIFLLYIFCRLGISFIVAGYAMLISCYIAFVLVRQLYLLWRGTTMHEYKRAPAHNGSRNRVWSNWRAILN